MRTKAVKICLMILTALCVVFALCACSKIVIIKGIRIKEGDAIEIAVGEFSYEGRKIIVEYADGGEREVDLTEEMIPEAERLKFYKMGEQRVKVVYGSYSTTMTVNVLRRAFNDVYALEGYTCVYDGQQHRVTLNEELPEGASVEYVYGNTFTNAGTYNVVAVISKEGYVSKTLSAQLVIEKADYDLTELSFVGQTFVYDGNVKALEVANAPQGVSVRYNVYSGNIPVSNAVNAGEYRVVAHFDNHNPNYNDIPDRQAMLVIEKAEYDMSNVKLSDVVRTYDGQNYVPALQNASALPSGVSVSFACYSNGAQVSSNANAGEYVMVASFSGNSQNYYPIPDIRATLVVNKRVVELGDGITFDDMGVNFDKNKHSLSVAGQLPQGVTVTYENNDQVLAGEYEVIAHFHAIDPNETVDVEQLTAYLIINPVQEDLYIDGHEVSAKDLWYDKNSYTMTVPGLDTDVYAYRSIAFYHADEQETKIIWGDPNDALVDGESYRYSVDFYYVQNGFEDSILLPAASGTFVYSEPELQGGEYVYDGTAKTVQAENVSEYYEVTYEYYVGEQKFDCAINAGEYRAVAVFMTAGTSRRLGELSTTLTVHKAEYDLSETVFESAVFTYDGQPKLISVKNAPQDVGIEYEFTKDEQKVDAQNVVNVGEYGVIARFNFDKINYLPIDDMSATITIEKAELIAGLSDKLVKFEGSAYSPDLDEGYYIPYGATYEIVVTRDGEKVSACDAPGVYQVTATFTVDRENVLPHDDLTATIRLYDIQLGGVVDMVDKVYEFDNTVRLGKDTSPSNMPAQNVPDGVDITYEFYKNGEFIGNDGVRYAGEYTVVARFTPKDPSSVTDVDYLSAQVTINKHVYKLNASAQDFWYDENKKTINIAMNSSLFKPRIYILDGITLEEIMFGTNQAGFDNDDGNKTYNYIVEYTIVYDDQGFIDSVEVRRDSGSFKYADINKGRLIKIYGVVQFTSQTVEYDGQTHRIEATSLPEGVTVTYRYRNRANNYIVSTDGVSEVGTYTVYATFSIDDDYAHLEVDEIIARLIINAAEETENE